MGSLLLACLSTAYADDCDFRERDYLDLQHTLRAMRRASGPFTVTAEGKRCQQTLTSTLRNAPLLHASLQGPSDCQLVLHGSPDVFTLEPVGPCTAFDLPAAFSPAIPRDALVDLDAIIESNLAKPTSNFYGCDNKLRRHWNEEARESVVRVR